MKKGQIIEGEVERVSFPSKGQMTIEGQEVRFKGGIKGQKISLRISRKRKDYLEGKLLEVLEKSPLETREGCNHFGICGGCQYQTLDYEDELKYKKDLVEDLFKASLIQEPIESIERSPQSSEYRNKMEYTFGDEYKDGPLALGLHQKGRFYEIVSVKDCNIVDQDFRTILTSSLDYFREKNLPHYHKKTHKGLLRHLVVRKALSTGEIMVNLVTSSQEDLDSLAYVAMLKNLELKGSLVGILHTINDGLGDTVAYDNMKLLDGRDYIIEEIQGLKFKVSPSSFFQTNSLGAEKLYEIVKDFAGDVSDKLIFDLYSGTGTIGQIMAKAGGRVIGIEIVEDAVKMARENAKLNFIKNAKFIHGDVFEEVEKLDSKPDLIVIDPPRDGIHPKAINKIINFGPKEFIYVSCNPVTLVRDLKVFKEEGYDIKRIKLMDQFPRTSHVESIILMTYCG